LTNFHKQHDNRKDMADKPLSPDQQEKLSRIMAVGSSAPLPASYKVADLPEVNPNTKTPIGTPMAKTPTESVEKTAGQKKSNSWLPILLIIVGVILLAGYAYFWLKYFGII
jgi:hypothetical protein